MIGNPRSLFDGVDVNLTMLVTAALENVRPFSAAVVSILGLH